jgi:hypothetical protein
MRIFIALGCSAYVPALAEPVVCCASINNPKRQREQDAKDDSFG